METKVDPIDEYLKQTKSTVQQLFAGANQVGMDYIIKELIPKAMKENKKLVWKDTNLDTGEGEYLFEDIS
jgi:hypothetical protein